jgi:hypothetical protein
MRTRTSLSLLLAALSLAACSSSSGVDVSHDWSGVHGYVVADVNGLETVVGIDTDHGQARSLVVIPQRSDDDAAEGPLISRNGTGMTYLQRPTDAGPSTLYRLAVGDSAANRVGTLSGQSRLYPISNGWAEVGPGPGGSTVRLLGSDLKVRSRLNIPVRPDVVATDGRSRVCIASNTETSSAVVAVDLQNGAVGRLEAYPAPIDALACRDGKPLIAISGAIGAASKAAPEIRLTDGKPDRIEVIRGRLDGFVVSLGRAYAVVAVRKSLYVLVVDLANGRTLSTHLLRGLQVADDVFLTSGGLVVAGGNSAAVFNPGTGKVATFALPGQVYPS